MTKAKWVVVVTGTDGTIYTYGMFKSREHAERFAKEECSGYPSKAQEVCFVARNYR